MGEMNDLFLLLEDLRNTSIPCNTKQITEKLS